MSDAKGTATQPLRVSVVDYLNARPLFSALADDPRVALTRGQFDALILGLPWERLADGGVIRVL